jgi:hypothetical protein
VYIGSSTPAISSVTQLQPRGDWVVLGRSTACRGTTQSVVWSTIPCPPVSAVPGDTQSPTFHTLLINSSGSAYQWLFFRLNDACDFLPLSLVDLNSRGPRRGATTSPAYSVVRGTSPGNYYQNAREHCIDDCVMWMEDDHTVDIAE